MGRRHPPNSQYQKKISVEQRQREIIRILREDPGINHQAIAEQLGVHRATISRDLRSITENLRMMNSEAWMAHRDRILLEIESNKQECMRRLAGCKKAYQGARWMEEWTKLLDKQIKILGLNAPERFLVNDGETFDKRDADAAVQKALASLGINVIDVTPEKKELPLPQMIEGQDA
jgi:hypothetical protein